MKFKTVAYKGSKRKLLENIEHYAEEIGAKTVFDGFSGTGIVSAHMRSKGYTVAANDLNHSSYIYGSVFLNGYNPEIVSEYIEQLNSLQPLPGWLTENYGGARARVIRGTNGSVEKRPRGFTAANAAKLDAARDFLESQKEKISLNDYNALVFSIILAADKVFNNSNDQKSALKEWIPAALKDVLFSLPTLISGPTGIQTRGDILNLTVGGDLVYLDPPYTHGVLYASCYHLNDSIARWDKSELDHDYAIARPKAVCFRKNGQKAGGFYNKESAKTAFNKLIGTTRAKRIVLSYSDAPRNTLSITELVEICQKHGEVKIHSFDHRICTQPKVFNKISKELKEFFIVVDKEHNKWI